MAGKHIELTGETFGRLTVIRRHPENTPGKNAQWVCKCSCGNSETVIIAAARLRNGATKSCGCLAIETAKKLKTKHGMRNTPEYEVWRAIKKRCYNPNHEHYDSYGGRGILMCDEWREDFMAFYNDMGPRPSSNHSLDREENDKGYDKNNCRWATWEEQNNNRRNSHKYTHGGKTLSLPEWSRELGVELHVLKNRIHQDWTFEEAIGVKERIGDQYAFEFNGQTRTLKVWCHAFGVPYETVRKRLKRGIQFAEAIRLSVVDKLFLFDGTEKRLSQWCDMLHLDLLEISKRIMNGETFESIALE